MSNESTSGQQIDGDMMVVLNLNLAAVELIIYALGELPAKTNSHAVAEIIRGQALSQMQPPTE